MFFPMHGQLFFYGTRLTDIGGTAGQASSSARLQWSRFASKTYLCTCA